MRELPEAASSAIVRGMAAFMNATNRVDLPPKLRSLQGKHVKMLTARRADLISALDDDALRARVLDWIDNKPTGITKADAEVLGVVARRDDGWEDRIAPGTDGSAPRARSAKPAGAALEREKEKVRKARDEVRQAKETAAREVSGAKERAEKLASEIVVLQTSSRELRRDLDEARRENESLRTEMEREARKARRRAEKAEAALEEAKSAVRSLRAELAEAKQPRAAPASATAAPGSATQAPSATIKKRPSSVPPVAPTRRKRLSAPKGRFADAPETLTEWLATPDVHLLIDGYNVSKAKGGYGDLHIAKQRDRLIQEVGRLVRKHEAQATIVFDGSDIPPGTSRRARGPVAVEYSRPGEIGDDHLIAKLEGLPKHPVIVVTNDRELQSRAARIGATIATSNQLLGLIRPSG